MKFENIFEYDGYGYVNVSEASPLLLYYTSSLLGEIFLLKMTVYALQYYLTANCNFAINAITHRSKILHPPF